MKRNQEVVVIADGWIRGSKRNDSINFRGSCVQYACHRTCWDEIEDDK